MIGLLSIIAVSLGIAWLTVRMVDRQINRPLHHRHPELFDPDSIEHRDDASIWAELRYYDEGAE
jgi:peptidoglycan/LPS O-acetylase OafA/YrhL